MSSALSHVSRLSPLIHPDLWHSRSRHYSLQSLRLCHATLGIASCLWSNRCYACFSVSLDSVAHLWPISFDRFNVADTLIPLAAYIDPEFVIFEPWVCGPIVDSLAAGVRDIGGDFEYPPLEFDPIRVKMSVQEMGKFVRAFRDDVYSGQLVHPGDAGLTASVLSCQVFTNGRGCRPEFPWDSPQAEWELAVAAVLATGGWD